MGEEPGTRGGSGI